MTKTLIIVALLLISAASHAGPINYQATFTVDHTDFYCQPNCTGHEGDAFIDPLHVGDQFVATMTTDSSILAHDGPSNAGLISAFHLDVNGLIFDPTIPSYAIFELFRFVGPCVNIRLHCTVEQFDKWWQPSKYLGFEVADGEAIKLWGGVVFANPTTYLDFNGDRFGGPVILAYNSNWGYGAMSVRGSIALAAVPAQVPEPYTLALMFLGLIGIVWRYRK